MGERNVTSFPTLGIRIENGRVKSRWFRRDLGSASKLYAGVRDEVTVPSPPAAKGRVGRRAEWKYALLAIGYPDGTWKYKKISAAHPQNADGDVPSIEGWKWDRVALTQRECNRAMNMATQAAKAETTAGQLEREARIQRRKRTREREGRQDLVAGILKASCTICGAESGAVCRTTEGEMILLDKSHGIMVHPFRIASAVITGQANHDQIKTQFAGKVPVSLQAVL